MFVAWCGRPGRWVVNLLVENSSQTDAVAISGLTDRGASCFAVAVSCTGDWDMPAIQVENPVTATRLVL